MLDNSRAISGTGSRKRRRRSRGFTLIEALVSAAILSIGIVSALLSLGALARREVANRQQEVLQRLAQRKYDELLVTSTDITTPQSGDFTDWNLPDYKWSTQVDTTGVDNLDAITVTVESNVSNSNTLKALATGVVYVPPQTSTTTGATQ